ncbi:MAG TPA: histidine kinase dimerization/phospho-acceptor domain-containing protein [Gemmatimonadaceae bacterium]|nr:histidine kinase dimerization/phospho-acceptor domain-containing protein [Gemmatimonadaceae bacterium]
MSGPAPDATAVRVACVDADAETVALVREALSVGLPAARVEESPATPPTAPCVVVPASARLGATLRELRARGYAGAVIVLADGEQGAADSASGFGVLAVVQRAAAARELPAAVATAAGTVDEGGRPTPAWLALRRVEQLVAAGEIALGLRHALNNPLAGLLAEAQLLEMESLPDEQHQAVRRIVELCRRTIAVARQLDAIGPVPGGGQQQQQQQQQQRGGGGGAA